MERASFAARHDFDSLSTDYGHRGAVRAGRRKFPSWQTWPIAWFRGFRLPGAGLGKYFAFDPGMHPDVQAGTKNCSARWRFFISMPRARRAHSRRDFADATGHRIACQARREVSATYIWAVAAIGRGIAGYGKVAAHLRTPRYVNANCFAQPSTKAGRELLVSTCFKPIPSFQPDLWCYERPWNRLPPNRLASNVSDKEFCRCTALNFHRQPCRIHARFRSASRAIPTISCW